jgi:hypothetical protein
MSLRTAAIEFVVAENVTDREELLFRAHRHASNLTGQLPVPVAQRAVQSFVAAVSREFTAVSRKPEHNDPEPDRYVDHDANVDRIVADAEADDLTRWGNRNASCDGEGDCDDCGATDGEKCRPWCTGKAKDDDEKADAKTKKSHRTASVTDFPDELMY